MEKLQESYTRVPENHEMVTPFGTYPEYGRMLSRDDLSRELEDFLREQNMWTKEPGVPLTATLECLVGNLLNKLKILEEQESINLSPRSQQNNIEQQIRMVLTFSSSFKFIYLHYFLFRLRRSIRIYYKYEALGT